jgi:hypothetical protein
LTDIHVDEAIAVNKERSNHQWILRPAFFPLYIVIDAGKKGSSKLPIQRKEIKEKT